MLQTKKTIIMYKHIVTWKDSSKYMFWSEYNNIYKALWNLAVQDPTVPRMGIDFVQTFKTRGR